MSNVKSQIHSGFTLIELLLVISIAAILIGLSTINLLKTQNSTSVQSTEEELISDIKGQQVKAMSGSNSGGYFGVHFAGNSTYTLFQNTTASYNSTSSTNFPVTVDAITFTASPTNIIFTPITGEMTPTDITISHNGGHDQRIVHLNKYGVVTQN